MATADSLLTGIMSAPTSGYTKTGAYFPIMWVRCKNTTNTAATIAVNAGGDIAFTTDGTTADTTVVATTGIIDLSTPAAAYDTLGEVLDVIKASGNWDAHLLGGIRAWAVDGLFYTTTEVTVAYTGDGVILYGDSSVVQTTTYFHAACLTGFAPDAPGGGSNYYNDDNCQSEINYINWFVNATTATNAIIKVYSSSQSADHLIFQVNIDNTATTWGNLQAPVFKSIIGERLVVILECDADPTAATVMYLNINGKVVDLSGEKPNRGLIVTNAAG